MATMLEGEDAAVTRLGAREVHVSCARLDRSPEVVAALGTLLSADELVRAGRFRFERDRARYTVGRASLRVLLGGYLGMRPDMLRFSYTEYRKPMLSSPRSDLSFNVSHSESLALYAVCRGVEVGIDVERSRPEPIGDRIPEHFFSPREVEVLRSLPDSTQETAFLRCWTRKEAFIKARGDGLTLPLDSFDVTLTEHEEPSLLRTAWDPNEAAEWSLHDLSPSFPGYAAAMAVRGSDWSVRIRSAEVAS